LDGLLLTRQTLREKDVSDRMILESAIAEISRIQGEMRRNSKFKTQPSKKQ